MKNRLFRLVVAFFLCVTLCLGCDFAQTKSVYVNGYVKKDGTYVEGYYRSAPDGNPYNNYSFPGNINPYTGEVAPGDPQTYLNNYYKDSSQKYSIDSGSYVPPVTEATQLTTSASKWSLYYQDNTGSKVSLDETQTITLNAQVLSKPENALVDVSYQIDYLNDNIIVSVKSNLAGKIVVLVDTYINQSTVYKHKLDMKFVDSKTKWILNNKSTSAFLNDTFVKLSKVVIASGKEMIIPVDSIAKSYGYTYEYFFDKNTRSKYVVLKKGNKVICFDENSTYAQVIDDGLPSKHYLSAKVSIKDGVLYLSGKNLAQLLSLKLTYGSDNGKYYEWAILED